MDPARTHASPAEATPDPAPAAAEPVESSALQERPRPIRACAWITAVVLGLGLAGGYPWLVAILPRGNQAPELMGGYLPVVPLLLFAVVALIWNPLLRWLRGPRAGFRPAELLVIAACLLAVSGIIGRGAADRWLEWTMAGPALANKTTLAPLVEALPTQLSLPAHSNDPDVAALTDAFVRARVQPQAPLPWSVLLKPLLSGGALLISGLILVVGIIAVTARQWTHNERLPHPLAQIPQAMTDGTVLRSKPFVVAFALTLVFWLWNLSSAWGLHPLGPIRSTFIIPDLYKLLGADAPAGWPMDVMKHYWGGIRIYPLAIGIAFLLTIDVGFSVWGGFWLGVLICGWLTAVGIPTSFPDTGRLVGAGATLGMAALIIAIGRHHYKRLVGSLFRQGEGHPDPVGVWGVRAFALAALLIVSLVWWMGGQSGSALLGGVCAVLLVSCYILVIARVVAECGLANFQAAHEMSLLANSLGLPLLLPYQALMATLYLGHTLVMDTRQNVAGYVVLGEAAGASAQVPSGRLLLVIGGVLIIGLILALVSTAWAGWTYGTTFSGNSLRANEVIAFTDASVNTAGGTQALFWTNFAGSPVLVGILLIFVIAGLRRVWSRCPLHPLGLVVAFSWPIFQVWGSLMLGWLLKFLILRYGGLGLYRRLKPLAYGLILGDLAGLAVQALASLVVGGLGGDVGIWRNP